MIKIDAFLSVKAGSEPITLGVITYFNGLNIFLIFSLAFKKFPPYFFPMFSNEPITRKKFAATIAKGILATTALGAIPFLEFQKGNIRIRPIAGKVYSPAFLALCERARFKSAQEAIRCVRDQVTEFELFVEEKI